MAGRSARESFVTRQAMTPPAAKPAAFQQPNGRHYEMLRPSDADAIINAWEGLAADAVEANPFFAPWMLGPALRHLDGEKARLLCIWDGPGSAARLIGLLPVARGFGYARLPAPFLQNWIYGHCFYGAPLVRRGAEAAFFESLFAFVDAVAPFGGFLRLRLIDSEGPFARALSEVTSSGPRLVYAAGAYGRAVLRGGYDAKAFVGENVRKKKLKEMNRRRNRLSELGEVSFRALQAEDSLDEWFETFVTLEDSGWKSEAGTSFRTKPTQATFLLETLRGARRAGALRFYRLDVGGKAIAMMINFAGAGQAYGFKICHDDAFARYSPGVMIEMELLEELQSMAPGEFIDSCAAPDHPMINSLWPERRRIAGYNISAANLASRGVLGVCGILENIGEKVRAK